MNFIDILIIVICIAGLIFFFFGCIKYSNENVYFKKKRELFELEEEIYIIKSENEETEYIIINMNADMDFDDSFTDKLIEYRDAHDRLETLKKRCIEIEKYLIKARPYIRMGQDASLIRYF